MRDAWKGWINAFLRDQLLKLVIKANFLKGCPHLLSRLLLRSYYKPKGLVFVRSVHTFFYDFELSKWDKNVTLSGNHVSLEVLSLEVFLLLIVLNLLGRPNFKMKRSFF